MSVGDELRALYRRLGVTRGRTVYVASDFGRMRARADEPATDTMAAHLETLSELLGPDGTIVVPTATLNLCNTDIVFDPATTPSHGMGVFSEYVRQHAQAERSFHPFWSVAALGGGARALVDGISRHSFGSESVWTRMLDADAQSLHIGVHPRLSFSVIHHVELTVGVPYRYTKEFLHPVRRGAQVRTEPFYHFVTYRDVDIQRDGNVKIFDHFAANAEVLDAPHARGRVWSFPMRRFVDVTRRLLAADIYAWLRAEPTIRPYRA
jgi:aminoglycoside 3-N-acetyltransferase